MSNKCEYCDYESNSEHGLNVHTSKKHLNDPEDRFWHYVDKKNKNECWEWVGKTFPKGYGKISYKNENKLAHRFLFEVIFKLNIDHKLVCHNCDNPKCVNPQHLYIGTYQTNVDDMIRRDRICNSEDYSHSKLNNKKVREIRERYPDEDITRQELGKEYGVSKSTIDSVLSYKTWKI